MPRWQVTGSQPSPAPPAELAWRRLEALCHHGHAGLPRRPLASTARSRARRGCGSYRHSGAAAVLAVPTDVSRLEDVEKLRDAAYAHSVKSAVLMNNAGTAPGGGPWEHIDRWRRVLEVNLWGVINGVQSFTPRMLEQGTPCAIVNTGSKQGITCPPGDTAYNVSKAGVKVLTEALAHSLRNEEGGQITAHLSDPGLHLHRHDQPRTHGKAAWRMDAGPGGRHDDRRDEQRRLLHPLPRQRRDARHRQPANPVGGAGYHREPARAVTLASGLRRCFRAFPADR